MTIDASPVNMEPTSFIMVLDHAVDIRLELTTMSGKPWPIKFNGDFGGFDVQFREMDRPATLGILVDLILHRRPASEQYVAGQNGIRVIHYQERPSFRQSMDQIGFA